MGDADTTGAICGQICGAFYGFQSIDSRFVEAVNMWEDGDIALKAGLLIYKGKQVC